MEKQLKKISEQQKESWNKFSPGWEKWDELFMSFLKPMGNEMIGQLQLKEHDVVLDIAAGTGEPGLSIAQKLSNGSVIITDLSENMLEIAIRNAKRRGIINIKTYACDVSKLPFADNSFDAISCRLGFMFFPDMILAAKEMLRVLKPGGRISASVWNIPAKNFWITAMMGPISKYLNLPPAPEGAPGIFRCSKEGLMEDLFIQAGFKNITLKEIEQQLDCKTTDVYWNIMTEVAAPVVEGLGKADTWMAEKIKTEVFQVVNQKYPQGNILMDSSALLIYGEK
ncbi:class I SAM-dependent methyltransferase [Aurantibacillus circumpalustris]|uniref:class I SAM-dependent methyltransferase n=1 Tax=Aurantibacillus circumpalustris TaxID=3036359 RepID=UPI00295BA2A0|nr:methyltransferase domain-containing protein [Aurantibacillus circumpalustris]